MGLVYRKYIVATSFIISVAIFSAGILLGMFLDSYRVSDLTGNLRDSELNAEGYAVEQQLAEILGKNDCEFLKVRLIDMTDKMSDMGHKLALYESGALPLKKSDYDYLKKRYFILESRVYAQELSMKEACNDNRTIILFFYRGGDDTPSIRQGYALDEIYKRYPSMVSTHSFDVDFKNSTIIDLLKRYYSITEAPAIVINNNITIKEFVSVGELDKIVRQEE